MKYSACLPLVVVWALFGDVANGAEPTDCSRIADADERLACFDELFSTEPAEAVEEIRSETIEAPATVVESAEDPVSRGGTSAETSGTADAPAGQADGVEPAAVVGGAAVLSSEDPEAAAADTAGAETAVVEPDEPAQGGLFNDPKVNLTTAIEAIRRGDKQKMVFRLENDQIWIQTSPRPLPFREGDTVTIKNGFFGGYFMRNERGTSTRVSRIK
jgi:hypothetical protein